MSVSDLTPDMLSRGYTINRSGNYRLTSSVSFVGVRGLEIAASGVNLDLSGYGLDGASITDTVVKLRKGRARFELFNGHITGGIHGIIIDALGRDITLKCIHVSKFLFAGLILKPCKRVFLTNFSVGRAAAAPVGTLFGILALPLGGFSAAAKITEGRDVSAINAEGGDGLVLRRVEIYNISPLSDETTPPQTMLRDTPSCFDKKAPPRYIEAEPSITTANGYRENSSCVRDTLPDGLGLTHSLTRRVEVLGSAYPREVVQVLAASLSIMRGAGVHACMLFNWSKTEGIPAELTISHPSPLPRKYIVFKSELLTGWCERTSLTIQSTIKSKVRDKEEVEEMSRIPLGITFVQVKQASSIVGPRLPGAMGSTTIA